MTNFIQPSRTQAPHSERRQKIVEAHPEIRSLFGPEWRSKYVVMLLVTAHVLVAVYSRSLPLVPWLAIVYAYGSTSVQALFLAIHELSHNLCFHNTASNVWFSILVNLPIGVPFAVAFRGYHQDHHKYQGVNGVDTDLPTDAECRWVRGRLAKFAWLSGQIFAYALRPCIVCPKPLTSMHVWNVVAQVVFNLLLVNAAGWTPLIFMITAVVLSGGLHPCAGHFLSEHYAFGEDVHQETYSYYGKLNFLTFNVGYHNEHHDFPYVPWSRLPEVRRIAREFYDPLETCPSWSGILWDYVMRDDVGPHSRVRRDQMSERVKTM